MSAPKRTISCTVFFWGLGAACPRGHHEALGERLGRALTARSSDDIVATPARPLTYLDGQINVLDTEVASQLADDDLYIPIQSGICRFSELDAQAAQYRRKAVLWLTNWRVSVGIAICNMKQGQTP